jgi:hypothetical protein
MIPVIRDWIIARKNVIHVSKGTRELKPGTRVDLEHPDGRSLTLEEKVHQHAILV